MFVALYYPDCNKSKEDVVGVTLPSLLRSIGTVQKRRAAILPKKDNEDFRTLLNSNFWKYLSHNIRQDILWMLGEDLEESLQGENVRKDRELHILKVTSEAGSTALFNIESEE